MIVGHVSRTENAEVEHHDKNATLHSERAFPGFCVLEVSDQVWFVLLNMQLLYFQRSQVSPLPLCNTLECERTNLNPRQA